MSDELDLDDVFEEHAANLRATATLVADYYRALKDLHVPDALAFLIVAGWHEQYMSPDGVEWDDEDEDED